MNFKAGFSYIKYFRIIIPIIIQIIIAMPKVLLKFLTLRLYTISPAKKAPMTMLKMLS